MTDNPSARQMLGYLFVRGGVHAPYALAQPTGVEMKKMLPIPKIENVALSDRGRSRRKACTTCSIVSAPTTIRSQVHLDRPGARRLRTSGGGRRRTARRRIYGSRRRFRCLRDRISSRRDLRDGSEAVQQCGITGLASLCARPTPVPCAGGGCCSMRGKRRTRPEKARQYGLKVLVKPVY